jgi:N-acetylglucosaminyl-diphospho-decaprenol L-rhamnosyltransferase
MSDFSVIIVNYNTADFLRRCLNSLGSQGDIRVRAIVVDNASHDDSQDVVKSEFPQVKLITNKQNLGFARANNQALRSCKSKYVYFLNPDTEVQQGTFGAILGFMDSHPNVGLAGTRIINPDGSPQPSVETRYPGQKRARQELRGLDTGIAWVLGASMIARRALLEDLGGFDERFHLYGEEQDLCLRARKAGWTIGYIPDAVVVHWGGQSERDTKPVEMWKKKFEAELVFYEKHYTKRTIRAIKRANLAQAFWRLVTLRLALPFTSNRENSLRKLDKYRLALKVFHL